MSAHWFSAMTEHQQQYSVPPSQPRPITVELLSEVWFIGLAVVAIVAYVVRLELGVKDTRQRIDTVTEEVLPELRHSVTIAETKAEGRLRDLHRSITAEIHTSLSTQQGFISSQVELILEKLNSRDTAIANIKEQVNRQGADIRELEGYIKYGTRSNHGQKED